MIGKFLKRLSLLLKGCIILKKTSTILDRMMDAYRKYAMIITLPLPLLLQEPQP